MPVKRRIAKCGRLCEYRCEALLHGPESTLLAGVGYLAGYPRFYDRLTAEAKAAIAERMRADWKRHGAALMAEWQGSGHPWAWAEFGAPQ